LDDLDSKLGYGFLPPSHFFSGVELLIVYMLAVHDQAKKFSIQFMMFCLVKNEEAMQI
jgi:hypothetical protein